MKIIIENPSIARIETLSCSNGDIQLLIKKLSYKNKNIQVQIKKLQEMYWFKNKSPDAWQARVDELKAKVNGCTVYHDDRGYYIRPGTIPYLTNIIFTVENNIIYPTPHLLAWSKPIEYKPYEYQSRAVEELIKIKHGNVEMATGAGKSLILLMICKQLGLNALVATPSASIFNELLVFFQKHLGRGIVGGYGDGHKDIKKKITIAIGKSLTNLQPGTEAYDFFNKKQVLCVDECHSWGADTLADVCIGALSNIPYRFFASGTVERNDGGTRLLESIVGKTVYSLDIKTAIEQGYLCPLQFKILQTISPSTITKKDPIEAKRVHFLYNPKIAETIAKIANASARVNGNSTLILVEELYQIQMLKKLIEVPWGYVHAGSKKDAEKFGLEVVDLQEQVDKFNEGKIKVLVGTKSISIGTNIFPTHNTVNWQGGSSPIAVMQGPIGRSTRKLELSKYAQSHKPKTVCTIFDFRVIGQPILEHQLEKRIKAYLETGGKISYF